MTKVGLLYYHPGRLSINVLGFNLIGLLIFTAWQLPRNPQHCPIFSQLHKYHVAIAIATASEMSVTTYAVIVSAAVAVAMT